MTDTQAPDLKDPDACLAWLTAELQKAITLLLSGQPVVNNPAGRELVTRAVTPVLEKITPVWRDHIHLVPNPTDKNGLVLQAKTQHGLDLLLKWGIHG